MGDRELLEWAAKAAGIVPSDGGPVVVYDLQGVWLAEGGIHLNEWWNPLDDDGDALRLAVNLSMSVEISEHEASTYAYAGNVPRVYAMELWRDNKDVATRRAIVRAAAEIGKATAPAGEGGNHA